MSKNGILNTKNKIQELAGTIACHVYLRRGYEVSL